MKVVLVSGGSRGLGAGLVDWFLRRGYKVASFSRNAGDRAERWRRAYPGRFYFDELDIADREACKRYVKRVQGQFGDIQVLVNNAGIAHAGLLPLADDESMDRLIDINLKATFRLTRLVVRPMLSLGWGRVINISSIAGLSGYRGLSVYGATKAGLDGFTRSLARELGPRNITVNSVAPGYLSTEMTAELSASQRERIIRRTPLGRFGSPEDVAAMVEFLADEKADFITGQVFVVDGGLNS